jgi:hypothetical protein
MPSARAAAERAKPSAIVGAQISSRSLAKRAVAVSVSIGAEGPGPIA